MCPGRQIGMHCIKGIYLASSLGLAIGKNWNDTEVYGENEEGQGLILTSFSQKGLCKLAAAFHPDHNSWQQLDLGSRN